MTNIQKKLGKKSNQSLLHNKSGNDLTNNLKVSKKKKTITDLNLVRDGGFTLLPERRIHLRHRTDSKASNRSQIEAGILGKHLPGLNSIFSCSNQPGCRQTPLSRTAFAHTQPLRSLFS